MGRLLESLTESQLDRCVVVYKISRDHKGKKRWFPNFGGIDIKSPRDVGFTSIHKARQAVQSALQAEYEARGLLRIDLVLPGWDSESM